jgi:hypothetical protein
MDQDVNQTVAQNLVSVKIVVGYLLMKRIS